MFEIKATQSKGLEQQSKETGIKYTQKITIKCIFLKEI